MGVAAARLVGAARRDLRAATAMGQLRSLLRAQAWQHQDPGEVLTRTDRLMQGLEVATLATAWFARLEGLHDEGPATLRYADAGHLPPADLTTWIDITPALSIIIDNR